LQDFSSLVHPTAIPVIQTPSTSTITGHINIPTENLPDVGHIPGLPTGSNDTTIKGTVTIDVSQSEIKPDERVMEIDVSEPSEVATDVSDVLSQAISEVSAAPAPQVWDSRKMAVLLWSEEPIVYEKSQVKQSTPKPFKCNFCRTHNTFDTVAELDSHKAFYHRPPGMSYDQELFLMGHMCLP